MGKYKDLFCYLLRMFCFLFQSQQYAAAQGLAELCKDPKYVVRVRNTKCMVEKKNVLEGLHLTTNIFA